MGSPVDDALDRLAETAGELYGSTDVGYSGCEELLNDHREALDTVRQYLRTQDAELQRLREERDALREALTAIRDCAKWYGEGERLAHEIHHALVVEVYAVADVALTREQG